MGLPCSFGVGSRVSGCLKLWGPEASVLYRGHTITRPKGSLYGSFRKLGVPYFGVRIKRILLLYGSTLFELGFIVSARVPKQDFI